MTNKKYDTLVYIGRFQPVHIAHTEIIRRATEMARQVIIIVGSANQPRTYKNPFTSQEREAMLVGSLRGLGDSKCSIKIEHNIDTIYNDQAWAVRVQNLVMKHTYTNKGKVGIIGHDKDESTFYLKMFPQWSREEVELIEPLNATEVRDIYFKRDSNLKFLQSVVPHCVMQFLEGFKNSTPYEQIIREREFINTYRKQYESLPYPPVFVTVDSVVIQSGHVLMIRRRSEPGKGLWALPGGFLNAETDKSVRDAAIRELREETGIKVPAPVLIGSIKDSMVFDAINRSARGRTITHCFKIVLPDGELPKVKGCDDADKACWVPIAEVKSEETFEDHFEIIQHFVGA
jgi:bifunctional NMN adenylyltransferase/nudix hydrolase